MIIEALLGLVYKLMSLLISSFNVPAAPQEFIDAIPQFFGYLKSAQSLIALVFPIELAPFLTVTLIILAVDHGYPFIMWILRKIPFLGIE